MKIKPLFDRILILPNENEKTSKGGIILPTAAQETSQIAKVVAVGIGGILDGNEIDLQVKVGDTVIYSKYAGTEIKIDNVNYIIIRQADIMAIVE